MGHKHPRAKLEPHPSKTPKKAGFDENALLMRPAWRIGHMEMCDPFGWHEVDVATLEIIRERLKNFETMSIVDFFGPKRSATWSKPTNYAKKQDRVCLIWGWTI